MRFASRFGNYSHGVRAARTQLLGHDERGRALNSTIVPELRVQFVEGKFILSPAEVEVAVRSMVHRGLPIDNQTNEHASARSRISGFDTEIAQAELGWTDEERELVEKTLLESAHYGSDHIELKAEKAQAPWPTYDQDDPEHIVLIARATGLVDRAVVYERENLARDEVIQPLLAGEAQEEAVVVNAS